MDLLHITEIDTGGNRFGVTGEADYCEIVGRTRSIDIVKREIKIGISGIEITVSASLEMLEELINRWSQKITLFCCGSICNRKVTLLHIGQYADYVHETQKKIAE